MTHKHNVNYTQTPQNPGKPKVTGQTMEKKQKVTLTPSIYVTLTPNIPDWSKPTTISWLPNTPPVVLWTHEQLGADDKAKTKL